MKNRSRRVVTPLLTLMLAMHMTAAHPEDAPPAIANAMPGTNISSTSATVIDGLYEVIAGNNVLYIDESGRYLVIGSIYDLQEDVDLSAARRAQVKRTSALSGSKTPGTAPASLPLTAAITTGDGDRTLTIVTDPQCGWCRRLWLESLSSLDGVTIRHLLLHPSAQALGIL
ncbi:MAG: DsbC family protein, partial [Woeseia sp.]